VVRLNKLVFSTILLLVCLIANLTQADIYQWTDENGKVHFSDKPPRDQHAENITDTTDHINTDTSARERKKVGELFAPPTAEEKRYQQQQAQNLAKEKQAKQQYCERLNKELRFFKNERFYWVDDKGNSSDASEDERRDIIGKLEKAIKENC